MNPGRLLLADDEKSFLESTSLLLRERGYECESVQDAPSATGMLERRTFDALITDIRMPGNADMKWIRQVRETQQRLPVIVVTGHPTLETAIESVDLHLFSYLVKPLKFDDLLTVIHNAVQQHNLTSNISSLQTNVGSWAQDLKGLEDLMKIQPTNGSGVSVNTFINSTLHNIMGCLVDLKNLTDAIETPQVEPDACHVLNCPRPALLIKNIREAIQVLEETKSSFKSRRLKELRENLVSVIEGLPED